MFVYCFSMYCFTFDNNSKNCSRDILNWFLYISRSSLVHSTNNVFDAPNVLRLFIHGLTHQRLFPFISFFLKCVDILLLNSHILQHLPSQVHLLPFWNRLPHSLLWNRVNSIVQLLNSVSLIQPCWSTWGTRVNAPLTAVLGMFFVSLFVDVFIYLLFHLLILAVLYIVIWLNYSGINCAQCGRKWS